MNSDTKKEPTLEEARAQVKYWVAIRAKLTADLREANATKEKERLAERERRREETLRRETELQERNARQFSNETGSDDSTSVDPQKVKVIKRGHPFYGRVGMVTERRGIAGEKIVVLIGEMTATLRISEVIFLSD